MTFTKTRRTNAPRAEGRENEELFRALDRLVRAYQFRDRQQECYEGLSVNECYALQVVLERDGPTQNEVAVELLLDKSTTSRLVDRLESHGFIRRELDPGDARRHLLRPTRAGKLLHAKIHRGLLRRQHEWIGDLPAGSRRAAIAVLERLAEMAAQAFERPDARS